MELSNISEWMRMNKLSVNPKNSEYMIIGHPRKTSMIGVHEQMRLNGLEIKGVANTKSLGIIVDEGLNWEQQFKTVYNKSRGGLESLKTLKNILSQSSLSNLYRALVESNMWYADVIWGNLSNSKIESCNVSRTEPWINGLYSMIHGARIKDNWTPNFLTVKRLTAFDRAVMVYKILNQICPENL